MSSKTILSAIFILALTCCNQPKTRVQEKRETPEALKDNSSRLEEISKRGDGNLVESLYTELVSKTPELKQLEDKIESLSKSEDDSIQTFDRYNIKNSSYYGAADAYIEQIKDSSLKIKMKALIANSLGNYKSSISEHKELIESISEKDITLRGLHTILKITTTLSIIEKFQKDKLPTTTPIAGYLKQVEGVINDADSASKKSYHF